MSDGVMFAMMAVVFLAAVATSFVILRDVSDK